MDAPEKRQDRDRLSASRRLVQIAVIGSFLMAGGIAAHAAFGADRLWAPARSVLEALDLPTLALVPSGRPERVPATLPAGIDLRHDPSMNLPASQLDDLLRKGSGP